MKKRLLPPAAGAALAMGIVTGLPAVANAVPAPTAVQEAPAPLAKEWPKDCSYGKFKDIFKGEGTEAYCKSGGGKFKALVLCKPWSGGPIVNREAPVWQTVGNGKHSYVYCPPNTVYSSSGIMTKAG
ncbi:hypothetical protein [Streptomyces sp. UG1]|uniref:hypothetical protein n=1 Tax=Streptomyces sp. UG1 TaxID=3417652 RepID=UPI003CF0F8ED